VDYKAVFGQSIKIILSFIGTALL